MKTLLTLLSLSFLTVALAAQTPAEKIAAARAAENKSIVLAQLKQQAQKEAVRLYLKVKAPVNEGLLCARKAVEQVPTNKRRSDGSYITTDQPAKTALPDVILLNEKPRPAGTEYVLLTVYPAPKPATCKRDLECYTLTPEASALARYEARQSRE